jgi:hypothetical protein
VPEAEVAAESPDAQAHPADGVDRGDIGLDEPPDVAEDHPCRPGPQLVVDEHGKPGGVRPIDSAGDRHHERSGGAAPDAAHRRRVPRPRWHAQRRSSFCARSTRAEAPTEQSRWRRTIETVRDHESHRRDHGTGRLSSELVLDRDHEADLFR